MGTVGARVVEQKTQLASPEPQKSDSLPRDPARHHQAEADRASSQAAWWDAAQLQQAAEAMAPEAQQPLERERRRAEALARELATARRDTETQVALATRDEAAQLKQAAESATAELRQSLQKEHNRTEALASELATARRDIETQVALLRKTSADTAEFKQTTESAMAELRQSLQKEHDRAEALASELVMARRDIEAHVARAQRDLETQVALSSKRGEEAVQVKQDAESATAELRQSLLNEQDRTEALARELARAQQDLKTQVALSRKTGGEGTQLEQAAESATAELRHPAGYRETGGAVAIGSVTLCAKATATSNATDSGIAAAFIAPPAICAELVDDFPIARANSDQRAGEFDFSVPKTKSGAPD